MIRRWGDRGKNKGEVPPPAQPWVCVGALQAPPSYVFDSRNTGTVSKKDQKQTACM